MEELIVLGIVPGTSIQITFAVWLLGIVGFAAYLTGVAAHRKHFVHSLLIASVILLETHRPELTLE